MVWFALRNAVLKALYKGLAKPFLFCIDPEKVHDRTIAISSFIASSPFLQSFVHFWLGYDHHALHQKVAGIRFKNPIGLAAGFDKNANMAGMLWSVGLGHAELGSMTALPYKGNRGWHLRRLIDKQSIRVNYGLKNEGVDVISARLRRKQHRIPWGISIAKTNSPNVVKTPDAVRDYLVGFETMLPFGTYMTLNISCPNAYGGLDFNNAKRLDSLLKATDKVKFSKPIFLKLSPDLSMKEVDSILAVCSKHVVAGFICSNLTKDSKKGGLSGKLVYKSSLDMIRYIYSKTRGKYVLMGCGGVFTAEDAYAMICAGASLIQMISGMIFEGPQAVSDINRGLVRLLRADGFGNLSEAVGSCV